MGRKPSNRFVLSGRDRARMYRERQKLKQQDRKIIKSCLQGILNFDAMATEATTNANDHEFFAEQSNENYDLKKNLGQWASQHRISKMAIDALLAILNSAGITSLPKNHRTLQGTPTNVAIENVAGGQLWYNGLENCLTKVFLNLDRNIELKLNFNIDGLPLFHSSKKNFYPILASVYGM